MKMLITLLLTEPQSHLHNVWFTVLLPRLSVYSWPKVGYHAIEGCHLWYVLFT